MKKVYMFFLITLTALMLGGCWDKVELEDRGFVISIGIDKGSEKKYSVVFALPETEKITKSESGDDAKFVKTIEADSVSEAMAIINSESSLKLYFGQTKLCLLGENLLSDARLVSEAIYSLENNNEFNRKMIVLFTDKKPSEILEATPPGEPMVGIFVNEYFKNSGGNLELTRHTDLENLISDYYKGGNYLLTKITLVDGEELLIRGTAVIKNNKFVECLDGKYYNSLLLLEDGGKGIVILSEPGIFKIDASKAKFKFYQSDEQLICQVTVDTKGTTESKPGHFGSNNADSDAKSENSMDIAQETAKIIAAEISGLFDQFRKEYNTDFLYLNEELKKWNYDLYQIYQNDWDKSFSEMGFDILVNCKVIHSGNIR